MLEPLAVKGGAPGGGSQEEAPGHDVARQPHLVPHPLEAEHRVVDEERDHMDPVRGISGAGGGEAGHGTGFVDSFLEDLAVLGLVIIKGRGAVDRFIELAPG